MIKVVIDTNVMVSAILAPEGTPAKILKLAFDGEFEFILWPLLVQEIEQVMRYPKIVKLMKNRGVSLAETDDILAKMRRVAIYGFGLCDGRAGGFHRDRRQPSYGPENIPGNSHCGSSDLPGINPQSLRSPIPP
jgi:hypothetical protein